MTSGREIEVLRVGYGYQFWSVAYGLALLIISDDSGEMIIHGYRLRQRRAGWIYLIFITRMKEHPSPAPLQVELTNIYFEMCHSQVTSDLRDICSLPPSKVIAQRGFKSRHIDSMMPLCNVHKI